MYASFKIHSLLRQVAGLCHHNLLLSPTKFRVICHQFCWKSEKLVRKATNFLTFTDFFATLVVTMQDEQSSFIQNDDQLLEIALSIDPKILAHFRLLEQPFRGGPDFRYLHTTDQVQEVLIQAVQLTCPGQRHSR